MKINKQAINIMLNCKKVAIYTHINPDGDCLGAASALKEALVSLNKDCDIFCDSPVPSNCLFIKYIDSVNVKRFSNYDLLIAVDCSDARRMGFYSNEFLRHNNTLKIDHHTTIENYAKINVTEEVSSTCLILYYYLKEMNIEFNASIANSLYAGISSDTGCFMHNNTSSLEHIITADLISYNFDLNNANYNLFKVCSLNKFELLKRALQSAEFFYNGKLGILKISNKDLIETKTDLTDTTGLVNYINNIEGVEIGIIIYEEKPGLYKCSFRSRGVIDVAQIAGTFGGGGHKYASGCNVFGNLSTVLKKLTDACAKPLSKLEK